MAATVRSATATLSTTAAATVRSSGAVLFSPQTVYVWDGAAWAAAGTLNYTTAAAPGDLVTLPAGTWTQTSGPVVTVTANRFTAPTLSGGAVLVFTSSGATMTVTVTANVDMAVTVTADRVTVTDSVSWSGPLPAPYPVTPAFLAALRTAHNLTSTATFRHPVTGVKTPLPIKAGSTVTVDVTAACRRVLSLVTPPLQSVFDLLSVPGGEITVTVTMTFIDRTTETLSMGVFCVDQEAMGYRPDGQLQVTAPDRWLRVQRNRFGLSRSSVPSNATWAEIKRLVEGAWPSKLAFPFPGWAPGSPGQSATGKVGSLLWEDGDREAAVRKFCDGSSLDLYFDRNGLAVLKPLPVLTQNSPPVWTVDASASGVLIDGTRQSDWSKTRNAVVVSTSATDIVLRPVAVANTNPGDPLSTLGALGYVPAYYSSPVLRSTAQMTAAGKTILAKQLSTSQQVTLTAVPNPALSGWDVIDVVYPPGDYGTNRPVDRAMIESTVIPLTPDAAQTITLRSTRPTADDTT